MRLRGAFRDRLDAVGVDDEVSLRIGSGGASARSPVASTTPHPDRGGRYRPHQLTITQDRLWGAKTLIAQRKWLICRRTGIFGTDTLIDVDEFLGRTGFAKTRKEPLAEYETRSVSGVESVTPSACPRGMIECGAKKLDRSAVALFYEPFSSSSSSGRRRKGA